MVILCSTRRNRTRESWNRRSTRAARHMLFPCDASIFDHDECVLAVLESSDRQGIVVFVHCGVLSVGIRAKIGLPSRFDMRFSNPIDLHSIALRFPNLNFVIPHFGRVISRGADVSRYVPERLLRYIEHQ